MQTPGWSNRSTAAAVRRVITVSAYYRRKLVVPICQPVEFWVRWGSACGRSLTCADSELAPLLGAAWPAVRRPTCSLVRRMRTCRCLFVNGHSPPRLPAYDAARACAGIRRAPERGDASRRVASRRAETLRDEALRFGDQPCRAACACAPRVPAACARHGDASSPRQSG